MTLGERLVWAAVFSDEYMAARAAENPLHAAFRACGRAAEAINALRAAEAGMNASRLEPEITAMASEMLSPGDAS